MPAAIAACVGWQLLCTILDNALESAGAVRRRVQAFLATRIEWGCVVPTFAKMSVSQAQAKSATGKRAKVLQEYMGYIQELAPGEAGVLEPGEGESTQAIRRRLSSAADALGKTLQVRRNGGAVYFWTSEGRRRGRPRKNTES